MEKANVEKKKLDALSFECLIFVCIELIIILEFLEFWLFTVVCFDKFASLGVVFSDTIQDSD